MWDRETLHARDRAAQCSWRPHIAFPTDLGAALPPARPRFTQPSKMRRRVIARPVGSSVRLKCVASGHPRPDILWMKDDQTLTRLEASEHRKKKWTLSLKNLKPEDSGKYTCRVSNRAGAINATYKVDVIREWRGLRQDRGL